ncbi:PREDICTED: F-box/kelch-repeat protein At3g06240-like [Erythranthe guttata]|uniref:F-box/kelch-repeat protein At3g06240-like n=1 Tax=Erythranthe guttata TaxID=4155 RepID=UPI00064DD804|nr:PREDICTED: F-box/kelch-repeat protein At3g06240-like [Erythranthe guttata]|eukprot:XP_012854399.1 PREDICTED: F-box/kelch-repeat protein At3g06240-like [Erythranthe guttata]
MVIVGSCNGLICVLVDACRFFLLNPSTRESEELPDFFTGAMFPKNVVSIRGYGFGFDESSGDYKVCAVCYMMFVFGSNMTFPSTARMYSLKADSWGRNLFFKDVCIFGSAKFVSGKLHWISDFKTKSKWDDVCFDLKSETFGIVKQTSCIKGYY